MNNQIGEVRVKHEFSQNWHLVVGVLNQIADRDINTAVNKLTDNRETTSPISPMSSSRPWLRAFRLKATWLT